MLTRPSSFEIRLPQFEGPFDLLLFFIERDELDIMNIPISKITNDFLDYLHQAEQMNIELASEFILVAATLMRIKARMLLPQMEKDEQGNEVDPRADLVNRLLEYKQFKEAAEQLRELESEREKQLQRGNLIHELARIAFYTEGSKYRPELSNLTLYKLMMAFEKVMQRYKKMEEIKHTVVQYPYSLEEECQRIRDLVNQKEQVFFTDLFVHCKTRMHAIFVFLAILDLIYIRAVKLVQSEGFNNFYLCRPQAVEAHDI